MTFNDDSNIGSNRVKRRGRSTGIAVGGGGIGVVIVVFLVSQIFNVDLSGLVGGSSGATNPEASSLTECQTGADANASADCRVQGAYVSLDDFWMDAAPALGVQYHSPEAILFDDATGTGCGDATSATGPFYCPPDETIYIDTSFYQELRTTYGASGGPLAELYVIAHEFGHHIQQLSGSFDSADRSDTGPESDSVRLELQADCYAGAWVAKASTTADANGVTFIDPVTDAQIADALSAASAVGDDRIQQASGGSVNSESWTHGSSEQRQRWFQTGRAGGPEACDTFAATTL